MDERPTPDTRMPQRGSMPVVALPNEQMSGTEDDLPQPQSGHYDQAALDVLREIKSQNEEQISFQRSTHELLVGLSDRVKQIADEASSRERRAILLELIMLHDSLEQALVWIRDSSQILPKEAILNRLETLEIELMEILLRRDVRAYGEAIVALDRRLHRAVRTVPTTDPSLNDRVERVVRPGFFWREQVLRPEEVVIFKHRPELPDPSNEKS